MRAELRCGRIDVRKEDVVVLDRYLASSGYRFPVVPRSEWFPGSNREQGRPELSKEAMMVLEAREDEAQS